MDKDRSLVVELVTLIDLGEADLQVACSAAVVLITGGVVCVSRTAYREIDELEEL